MEASVREIIDLIHGPVIDDKRLKMCEICSTVGISDNRTYKMGLRSHNR